MESERDELRRALEQHSVKGYPVEVPIFGPAIITHQPPLGGWISFGVRLEKPMPFDQAAERLGKSDRQMNLEEWRERYSRAGRTLSAMLPIDVMERLEAGGTASEKDREFGFLIQQGCLDERQRVVCYAFSEGQIHIPVSKLKRGMLVDYVEERGEGYGSTKGWAGRVVGFAENRKIVLLELLSATPFMRVPQQIVPERIRPGFYSSVTGAFGDGLAEAWEDRGRTLPGGRWTEDQKEYQLNQPIPLEEIRTFCTQFYPEHPHCTYHGMIMFIVPIEVGIGRFLPLPENSVDPGIVVEPWITGPEPE